MKEAIVKVCHLSHRYSVQWAVKDISFDIPAHDIHHGGFPRTIGTQ